MLTYIVRIRLFGTMLFPACLRLFKKYSGNFIPFSDLSLHGVYTFLERLFLLFAFFSKSKVDGKRHGLFASKYINEYVQTLKLEFVYDIECVVSNFVIASNSPIGADGALNSNSLTHSKTKVIVMGC